MARLVPGLMLSAATLALLHVMCLHAHTSNATWHVVLVVVLLVL